MRMPVRAVLLACVAIVAAHLGDAWAYAYMVKPGVYDHDLGRMLRIVGYLPIWFVLALALWAQTGDRRKALLLALVPTAGGLLAEVLKILLRRERPNLHAGTYVFRSFRDHPFSTVDIGLPSSHALVAFAGAWLLCRLFPRAWPVWLTLAAGCAWTRVQSQAHFLSDVTVAAVAAWFLVVLAWRWFGRTALPEG
jgi:membrane-associated phospholipid phosphatase